MTTEPAPTATSQQKTRALAPDSPPAYLWDVECPTFTDYWITGGGFDHNLGILGTGIDYVGTNWEGGRTICRLKVGPCIEKLMEHLFLYRVLQRGESVVI